MSHSHSGILLASLVFLVLKICRAAELEGNGLITGANGIPSASATDATVPGESRIILAYPFEGCLDSRAPTSAAGGLPILLGPEVRETVMRDLSFKVAEFLHTSGNPTISGQSVTTLEEPKSERSSELRSRYLTTLQMEVTSVPQGMTDIQMLSLADTIPCVQKAYIDFNKYGVIDNDNLALQNSWDISVDPEGIVPRRRMLQHRRAFRNLAAATSLDPETIIKVVEQSAATDDHGPSGAGGYYDGSSDHRTPTDTQFPKQWYLHASQPMSTQGDRVWPFWTGTGNPVTVAVIDSGCDVTHPDLKHKLWRNPGEICGDGIDNDQNGFVDDCHGFDFVNDDPDPMPTRSGHGTGAAGIIAAESNNEIGIAGICWGCTIMCLKFIGNGQGRVSDQVQAIDYAVKMGAKLSSNSYGGYGYSELEFKAIQRAQVAGHLFICSAGNNNLDTDLPRNDHTPSVYDLNNIVAVGATDSRGDKASFSNYGKDSVHVFAPGVRIRTIETSNRYAFVSGTSFAAPSAAGAAALIWSAFPGLSYIQVRQALMDSCLTQFSDPKLRGAALHLIF
eukprot:GHVQ01015912.1.p1 GENE.GHVQ01015912.1~~GHVQ01015912.1.p1  ORF type:complete len:562 (+),score=53.64 GHVQ01015912.1:424-2109(+)